MSHAWLNNGEIFVNLKKNVFSLPPKSRMRNYFYKVIRSLEWDLNAADSFLKVLVFWCRGRLSSSPRQTRFLAQLFAGSRVSRNFLRKFLYGCRQKIIGQTAQVPTLFLTFCLLLRSTLIFAYELPDSPRHPRWLQVIHLPTQKLARLLRPYEKDRGKNGGPRRQSNRLAFLTSLPQHVNVMTIWLGKL